MLNFEISKPLTVTEQPLVKEVRKKETKILFWNVLKKDLSDIVLSIALQNEIDIVLLAELTIDNTASAVDKLKKYGYHHRTTPSSKVKIFDRLQTDNPSLQLVKNHSQSNRSSSIVYTINGELILISGIHLYSAASMHTPSSRKSFASLALKVIEEIEQKNDISKSILIGDFNMNPYEEGMIDFFGLHATMCKKTAQRETRKISGEIKKYFFNPSWQAYSNNHKNTGPTGTYFFESDNEPLLIYWNLLDQVLIRPSLVEDSMDFKIITSSSEFYLLNEKSQPNKDFYSDHLPIVYSLML